MPIFMLNLATRAQNYRDFAGLCRFYKICGDTWLPVKAARDGALAMAADPCFCVNFFIERSVPCLTIMSAIIRICPSCSCWRGERRSAARTLLRATDIGVLGGNNPEWKILLYDKKRKRAARRPWVR